MKPFRNAIIVITVLPFTNCSQSDSSKNAIEITHSPEAMQTETYAFSKQDFIQTVYAPASKEDILKLKSENAQTLRDAQELMAGKDYTGAINLLNNPDFSKEAQIQYQLGVAYVYAEEPKLAETAFTNAIRAGDRLSYYWDGGVKQREQNYSAAAERFSDSFLYGVPSHEAAAASLFNSLASMPRKTDLALLESVEMRKFFFAGDSFESYVNAQSSTTCEIAQETLSNEYRLADALEIQLTPSSSSLEGSCNDSGRAALSAAFSLISTNPELAKALYNPDTKPDQ